MYLIHRLIIATRSKCSFGNVAGVHVLPVCTTCVPSVHPVMETPGFAGQNLKSAEKSKFFNKKDPSSCNDYLDS